MLESASRRTIGPRPTIDASAVAMTIPSHGYLDSKSFATTNPLTQGTRRLVAQAFIGEGLPHVPRLHPDAARSARTGRWLIAGCWSWTSRWCWVWLAGASAAARGAHQLFPQRDFREVQQRGETPAGASTYRTPDVH